MTSQEDALQLLQQGEITAEGLTRLGSNYTFLVRVGHNRDESPAIYKPRDGEAPLWDFPRGTLYKREYAAYLLSQMLGWDFIPPTVIRDGPHGIGSLQLFIEHDPQQNYFTIRERCPEALEAIACFDLIANNADRKPSHCILDYDGKVWSIDHGLTFNADLKVRTVITDFSETPISDSLVGALQQLEGQITNPQGQVQEMLDLLAPEEVESLKERATWLTTSRTFPSFYPRRHGRYFIR